VLDPRDNVIHWDVSLGSLLNLLDKLYGEKFHGIVDQ
jgi:hypothetical protein